MRAKGFNIIDIVKKYYQDISNNWIYESDLWLVLKRENIAIDYEQRKQLIQAIPYKNGKLDYKILNELIFEVFKEGRR